MNKCARLVTKLWPSKSSPTLETIVQAHYSDDLFERLYKVACDSGIREHYDHFSRHCITNDFVHLFRDPQENLLGFQFWKSPPPEHAASSVRIILGGKLRLLPDARRRGLHLYSNLCAFKYFASVNTTGCTFHRVGLVNIFGFNSLVVPGLEYDTFPFSATSSDARDVILPAITELSDAGAFTIDERTGVVDVGQTFSDAAIAPPGSPFWDRPAVRKFLELNPRWQDRDIFLSWPWNPQNLACFEDAANARKVESNKQSAPDLHTSGIQSRPPFRT